MNLTKGKGVILQDKSIWIFFALISHTAWGAYPVLVRYLQKSMGISTMSLSATANSLALLLLLLFVGKRIHLCSIKFIDLLSYSVVIISRNTVNLYAAQLTYATNVQLFSLLAPFIVALISALFYKEALPRHIGKALMISLGGSLLIILGGPKDLSTSLSVKNSQNLLGIGLSVLGGILMAFLLLEIRRIGKRTVSSETLAFYQFATLALFMTSGSIALGENWQPWLTLPFSGIIAFLVFVLVVLLLGTMLQNNAIKNLGAPVYSIIQAIRLIATIGFSWVLLGEGVETPLQWIGVISVIMTITGYMISQSKVKKP